MTTLLVDGDNIAMRATHAMKSSTLASATGVPTGAVLVFANMMSRYVRQVEPDHLIICWDGGRSVHRTMVWPDYKAARKTPDAAMADLKESAFDLIHQFCLLAGLPSKTIPGAEADDLIVAYWRLNWSPPLYVLSGDKDLLQLVSDDCTQLRPSSFDEMWTPERVQAEMGCTPALWGYVLALAGDASDGVPGVPRVGVKTACKDLAASGWNLEELLTNGPAKYQDNIEVVRRNVELIELRDHGPTHLEVDDAPRFRPVGPEDPEWPDLHHFLDRYQLVNILTQLRSGVLWHQWDSKPS